MDIKTIAVIGILCFIILVWWYRRQAAYEIRLLNIFLDSDIFSLEVTRLFGLNKVYFSRSKASIKAGQTPRVGSPAPLITIQIPDEIKSGLLQIKISNKLGLVSGSGIITFIVSTVDSPDDGIFTHDFDDSVDSNLKPGMYQIYACQHILSGKKFVHTGEKIGSILTSFGKTTPVESTQAGDIYFWIPSGTSVKKGDTLALMATKE